MALVIEEAMPGPNAAADLYALRERVYKLRGPQMLGFNNLIELAGYVPQLRQVTNYQANHAPNPRQ
jgi:hypothetical protein